MIGELILVGGALMALALGASLVAGRLRVPVLFLFLVAGMAIGSDGLDWLHFDDYKLARDIGIVALVLIMFEGGLSTRTQEMFPVLWPAASLSVLATLLTAVITGVVATGLFDLSLLEGLLLGSIVASTDAAAVFAQLRGSALRPRLARMLEGEAGSNDPVAILLVLGLIEWINVPDYGLGDMIVLFAKQLVIGGLAGLAIGLLGARLIRSLDLSSPGLYPVASLTVAAVAFGLPDTIGGSGFLAVYLAGLTLNASSIPAQRTIEAFHEGLAWVAQLTLFLSLGLLVFPSQLGSVAPEGIALALVLALVARPVASLAATAFASLSWPERALIGWAGLRGAVPVVLATFPVIAEVPHSLEFFNIVFFAVLVSLLLQGPTIEPLAERLGVTEPVGRVSRPVLELGVLRELGAEVLEVEIGEDDAAVGARVRDLGLPRDAVVSLIVRGGEAVAPRGSTRLLAGDRLHVLARGEVADQLEELAERWRNGPLGRARRERRQFAAHAPIFTVAPAELTDIEGELTHPTAVGGVQVDRVLRERRDVPGALAFLADGRYAITGPLVVAGGSNDLTRYAARRMRTADPDERAWLQNVIGALAVDVHD